jgi:hypothetical protein
VGAVGGFQPGNVGGGAEGGVDLHGTGERPPRVVAVTGVGGMAREGVGGGQVAGLGGEADGVGQQVLDLAEFFRTALKRPGQRSERRR